MNLGIWQVYRSEHRELSLVASIFSMKWDERCLPTIGEFNTGLEDLEFSFFKKCISPPPAPLSPLVTIS